MPRSVSRSRRWKCVATWNPQRRRGRLVDTPPGHTARPLRVPVLRQERCQAPGRRYLELPLLPQDHRRWCLHRRVRLPPAADTIVSNEGCATQRNAANTATAPLPPPPQGRPSVVSARSLRFKGALGAGMVEFFERVFCISSHHTNEMVCRSFRIPVL